jgi:hypothetical protein
MWLKVDWICDNSYQKTFDLCLHSSILVHTKSDFDHLLFSRIGIIYVRLGGISDFPFRDLNIFSSSQLFYCRDKIFSAFGGNSMFLQTSI